MWEYFQMHVEILGHLSQTIFELYLLSFPNQPKKLYKSARTA